MLLVLHADVSVTVGEHLKSAVEGVGLREEQQQHLRDREWIGFNRDEDVGREAHGLWHWAGPP